MTCSSLRWAAWPVLLWMAAAGGQSVDSPVLEEIIVTATKRETALQDTALSVAVLNDEQLQQIGAFTIEDLWRMVPSLTYADQGFAGNDIAIRGLGNDFNSNVEAMAAIYLDDIPLTAPDGLFTANPDIEWVDVARVEVLRGPQGTLFGASAMGGAVRTVSQLPDPSASARWIQGALASIAHGGESLEASAMLNEPLGKRSALRLVAHYRDRDGFIDDVLLDRDDINDERTAGVRLAFSTAFDNGLSLVGRVLHQDTEGGANNSVMTSGIPLLGVRTDGDYETARRVEDVRDDQITLFSLTLDKEASWGSWTSITAVHEQDVDLTLDLSNLVEYAIDSRGPASYTNEVFSQEFRVTSRPEDAVQWLAGLFYLDQDTPRRDLIIAPDLPEVLPFLPPDFPDVIFDVRQSSTRRDLGLFGEVTWPLSGRLSATVGARWFDIDKYSRNVTTIRLREIEDRVTAFFYQESGLTPKLALSWDLEETLVYASAAKGYRAGGGNAPFTIEVCGAPESYESDELWNYEVGLKRSWSDLKMRLNLAAYTIDWSNAQQKVRLPDCRNIFIDNVGEVGSDGLELEWWAGLSDSWELQAALGYNRSKLDEDAPEAPRGTDIPLIPDITASISSTHGFNLFDRSAYLRVDIQHTGDSETNLNPALNVGQDAYTQVHLRLGVEGEGWNTVLFADNVFDEQGAYATALPTELGAAGGFVTTRPRTVGVRASYRFD